MKYTLIAVLVLNLSTSYAAIDTKSDTLKVANLLDVTIQSKRDDDSLSMIGKSTIKEMDLPQSTMVINEKIFKQQQISSMSDLLKNANGMYIMGTTGGYQEEIASRGSNITSTNTFKNGVRYFGGMYTELSGIEKAEIMKGNTAILFGNVAPGGVLNLVTKKPSFNSGANVGLNFGSFEKINPTIDVYGPLTKFMAYRLNASYMQSNSFRKEVSTSSFYVNPSFLINLTEKTSLLVEADYTKYETTPDFGAGIINYELVEIPRDRFLGVSWGKYTSNQTLVSSKLTHEFNKNIYITALSGIRTYSTELFSNTRPNASGVLINSEGNWVRNIQRTEVDDTYFIEQVDLNIKFKTGPIKHQALIGSDFENFRTTTLAYNNFNKYDTVNIFKPYDPSIEKSIPELTKNTNTLNPVARMGFYAQDLISFNKYLKVLAGIRYSSITSETEVYKFSDSSTTINRKTDNAFSPKIGLVLQPSEYHTLFASYSNSFSINTGVDVDGNALKPSIIDQYELGLKNKLINNKLSAQVTVYKITNSNLAQTSLANGNTNSNIKELAGETVSKGLEVDFTYYVNPFLNIISGYSFNQTKYTKSNIYIEGSELRYNPNHTANFSVNYTIHKGILNKLNVGLSSVYIGNRYAGRSTRLTVQNDAYKLIPLEDYLLFDATASYSYKQLQFRFKLANINNVLNYNAHDDNSLNPIAPRNFTCTIQYSIL